MRKNLLSSVVTLLAALFVLGGTHAYGQTWACGYGGAYVACAGSEAALNCALLDEECEDIVVISEEFLGPGQVYDTYCNSTVYDTLYDQNGSDWMLMGTSCEVLTGPGPVIIPGLPSGPQPFDPQPIEDAASSVTHQLSGS